MNIYRVYYIYNDRNRWLYIKAITKQEAMEIFKNSMNPETEITFISEVKEHQIERNDITLNFTIDFEKNYTFG